MNYKLGWDAADGLAVDLGLLCFLAGFSLLVKVSTRRGAPAVAPGEESSLEIGPLVQVE